MKFNITCIVGFPGSGKSTFGAYLVNWYNKRGIPVYCNYEVKGAYLFDFQEDIGTYAINDCVVIVDESGICANNRSYKSFSKDIIKWLKRARHEGVVELVFLSQANDMDITIRRLCNRFYLIRKLGPFSILQSLKPAWSKEEHDDEGFPVMVWKSNIFGFKFIFRPKYYKCFNSFDRLELPKKDFKFIE